MSKNNDIVNFEEEESYMQSKEPITCNKGNCYLLLHLHLVVPTANVKVL